MESLILIVGFVFVLVILTVAAMWMGPDNRQPRDLDTWTAPWAR